ncbi:MAG: hypothetical protein IPM98_22665 [Lewinellaceae bacterium]|nr:hypothetical protein [Lewinellaceae bacterium]
MDVSSVTTSDNCGGTVTVPHIDDVPNSLPHYSRTYQAKGMLVEIPSAARRPSPWTTS